MKRFHVAPLALIALLAALTGCGQKGPLYLPGSPDAPRHTGDEVDGTAQQKHQH